MAKSNVARYLRNLKIDFTIFEHPAVYTVAEAEKYFTRGDFLGCKNLFLKDRKSRKFYLVILPMDKSFDFNVLESEMGEKMKFANGDDLKEMLDIYSGAVGPFALINDKDKRVIVLINEQVWDAETVGFHPNDNTETWSLCRDDFHKYVKSLGNEFKVMNFESNNENKNKG